MIKQIRRKLVMSYTLAIMALLAVASLAGVYTLSHLTLVSVKDSLRVLLNMEIDEARPMLKKWHADEEIGFHHYDVNVNELAFVLEYWFDKDGTLIMSESTPEITQIIIDKLQNQDYPLNSDMRIDFTDSSGRTWKLIIIAGNIYEGSAFLGKAVVGINLTPFVHIINSYIKIALITILFISIPAFFAGNYFANRAVKPVEEAMRRQKEFVANASHELRTPLSILLSSVDTIESDDNSRQALKDIREEILQMRGLINSLLVMANTDNGNNAAFTKFDLGAAAEKAIKSIQSIAAERNIRITGTFGENIILCGDEQNIRLLINILLDNAVKYSPPDTVVSVSIADNEKTVTITVSDEGQGISEDALPHIFERFYRADTGSFTNGFGLGLPIAKLITEIHKGEINVESTVNKGTVVKVILPKR